MKTPTVSRIFVCSIFGLSVIALGFACDNTTTTPTPTPTPDMAVAPADMAMLVPVISTIAPAMGSTAGGTSVTITGSGFQQGATVKIGSLTVTGATVSADGTTITFTAPANLGKPGPSDVIVTNPNSNTTTKTAGFTYFITVTFATGTTVTQGGDRGPRYVLPVDLDKDNILDLAVAYANSSTVVTYKGTSAGATISFGTATPRGVNTYPFMVSAADVTGDGNVDLIAPCQNSTGQGSVVVMPGNGTISPGTPATVNVGMNAQKPQWTQLVDLNGDNKLDIVVNLNGAATANLAHLINNGTGGFTYTAANNLNAGTLPYSLTMGDFNKDGKADIVASLAGTGNNVMPFKHNGVANAPWLTAGTATATTSGMPYNAVAGDFDGDGNLDLVTVNNLAAGTISFLKGNGQGALASAGTTNIFTVGVSPEHIAAADLNGDGYLDVVVANYGPAAGAGTVSWLLGKGDGTFQGMQNLSLGNSRFNSVAVADLNKDGILDIIATDYKAAGTGGTEGGIVIWKGTGQ